MDQAELDDLLSFSPASTGTFKPVPSVPTPDAISSKEQRPLTLAERGAAAEAEFSKIEAARRKALKEAQNIMARNNSGGNAFDSRLNGYTSAASHRTPRNGVANESRRPLPDVLAHLSLKLTNALLHCRGRRGSSKQAVAVQAKKYCLHTLKWRRVEHAS